MTHAKVHPLDRRNLIADAYQIEDIGEADCRSIFFDWALGLDPADDAVTAAGVLLNLHVAQHGQDPAHPMSVLLRNAVEGTPRKHKGGSKARMRKPRRRNI